MKKVSLGILVFVLLFLTACTPAVSPTPPSGDVTTTTASKTALGGKLPISTTTTTTTTSVMDTVTLNGTLPTVASAEWAMHNVPGTGMEKPADYVPPVLGYSAYLELEEKNGKIVPPDWLTDTALQSEINAFITTAETELKVLSKKVVRASAAAVNGYLSVRLSAGPLTRTALYDLTAKKRIAFSDLFFKGVNFIDPLNEAMRREIHNVGHDVVDGYYEEANFHAFPSEYQNYTVEYISWGVGFSDYSVMLSEVYPLSVLSITNDMQGMFKDTVRVSCTVLSMPAEVEWYPLGKELGAALPRAETYGKTVYDSVKRCVEKRFDTRWSIEVIRKRFGEDLNTAIASLFNLYEISDDLLMISGGHTTWAEGDMESLSVREKVLFDRYTGKEVPYTVLLADNWQEHARFELENTSFVTKEGTAADTEGRFLAAIQGDEGGLVFVLDTDDPDELWRYCKVYVPADCIK